MWPIYITIMNIPSKIRNSPSCHTFVLLGVLPIPSVNKGATTSELNLKQIFAAELLQDTLKYALGLLTALGPCLHSPK